MNILFVCLGNICRSPAAEGIMKKEVDRAGLSDLITIDSAGTAGFHVGEPADARMISHAEKRGYKLESRSRAFAGTEDFENFDYIITMDDQNYEDVLSFDHDNFYSFKVKKMTDFCQKIKADHVPDPYTGGPESFEHVLDILEDSCRGLLKALKEEIE